MVHVVGTLYSRVLRTKILIQSIRVKDTYIAYNLSKSKEMPSTDATSSICWSTGAMNTITEDAVSNAVVMVAAGAALQRMPRRMHFRVRICVLMIFGVYLYYTEYSCISCSWLLLQL